MANFIYPRTVNITRPVNATSLGATAYSGLTEANETVIATGIAAAIQMHNPGAAPPAGLPGDTGRRTYWRIFLSPNTLNLGQVLSHDVVTDDLGERYQVTSDYWNSLGYTLLAEKLET